jgi:hypothetical protein
VLIPFLFWSAIGVGSKAGRYSNTFIGSLKGIINQAGSKISTRVTGSKYLVILEVTRFFWHKYTGFHRK